MRRNRSRRFYLFRLLFVSARWRPIQWWLRRGGVLLCVKCTIGHLSTSDFMRWLLTRLLYFLIVFCCSLIISFINFLQNRYWRSQIFHRINVEILSLLYNCTQQKIVLLDCSHRKEICIKIFWRKDWCDTWTNVTKIIVISISDWNVFHFLWKNVKSYLCKIPLSNVRIVKRLFLIRISLLARKKMKIMH